MLNKEYATMKLIDLIRNNAWLTVESALLQDYPEEEKNLSGYEEVFNYLKSIPVSESSMAIEIKRVTDDFDKEEYADVSGKIKAADGETEEQVESYALEFTPWSEWLGMAIDEDTLNRYTEPEIIAHCLYEMTFIGFDEETIQAERDKLKKQIDEIESWTDEEKEANTLSWEELKKRLGWDNGEGVERD